MGRRDRRIPCRSILPQPRHRHIRRKPRQPSVARRNHASVHRNPRHHSSNPHRNGRHATLAPSDPHAVYRTRHCIRIAVLRRIPPGHRPTPHGDTRQRRTILLPQSRRTHRTDRRRNHHRIRRRRLVIRFHCHPLPRPSRSHPQRPYARPRLTRRQLPSSIHLDAQDRPPKHQPCPTTPMAHRHAHGNQPIRLIRVSAHP